MLRYSWSVTLPRSLHNLSILWLCTDGLVYTLPQLSRIKFIIHSQTLIFSPPWSQRSLPGIPYFCIACWNPVRTVSALLFVASSKDTTVLENPSTIPWMTKPQRTSLWLPSRCHKAFGPETEYLLRETNCAQRCISPKASTRCNDFCTRHRCTLNPQDRREELIRR